MKKNVLFYGKEYPRKYITEVVIKKRRAALVRQKELFLFSKGFVHVRLNDGTSKTFSAGQWDEVDMIFHDSGNNKDQEVLFLDEKINANWTLVFVYFFDEDEGVYTFFAERTTMNVLGATYGTNAYKGSFLSQMALNIASLIAPSLLYEILDVEQRIEEDDMTLLTLVTER